MKSPLRSSALFCDKGEMRFDSYMQLSSPGLAYELSSLS
jgi:hypothetical protein